MASLLSLLDVVREAGAPRSLLYARVNWANLQGRSSVAHGAPEPSVARETLTRRAQRRKRQLQIERRGGSAGLARLIAHPAC